MLTWPYPATIGLLGATETSAEALIGETLGIPPEKIFMNPPKCRLCGHEHWLRDPHVFATNKEAATNNATNTVDSPVIPAVGRDAGRGGVVVGNETARPARTANRRTREAYNAYQREYMRKKRGGIQTPNQ